MRCPDYNKFVSNEEFDSEFNHWVLVGRTDFALLLIGDQNLVTVLVTV
jgi:hypothetical protein